MTKQAAAGTAFLIAFFVNLLAVAKRLTAMQILPILLLVGTTAAARDFDRTKICETIRNGWEVRIFYRPGEAERRIVPRFLGYGAMSIPNYPKVRNDLRTAADFYAMETTDELRWYQGAN